MDQLTNLNTISWNKTLKNNRDGIQINGDNAHILRNKSISNGKVGIRINGNNNRIIANKAFKRTTIELLLIKPLRMEN